MLTFRHSLLYILLLPLAIAGFLHVPGALCTNYSLLTVKAMHLALAAGEPEAGAQVQRFLESPCAAVGQSLPAGAPSGSSSGATFFAAEYLRLHGAGLEATAAYASALASGKFGRSGAAPNRDLHFWRSHLLPGGQILLDDFSALDPWLARPQANRNIDDYSFESDGEIAHFSTANRPQQRDRFAVALFPNPRRFTHPYHQVLALRVRIGAGAYLTLETVVDERRTRHVNYASGTGQWQELRYPIDGVALQEIKLILGEPPAGASAAPARYELWFDWVRLEVDLEVDRE